MFTMEQKCSQWRVFNVFVKEPLKIHYIKEIAKKINLAPTAVKLHLNRLQKQNLLFKKKGERFNGFVANRDNENFLFYKKIANLINLKESGILDFIVNSIYPQAIVLYGSYLKGEDVEASDIDLFILTQTEKLLELKKFETSLQRKIHIILDKNFKKLSKELKLEIINGLVLYGYLKDV